MGGSESKDPSPSIVLITGEDLEHRYVANRLDAEVGLRAVIVDHRRPVTRSERARQLWNRYTVGQLASRALLATSSAVFRDDERRHREVEGVLGPSSRAFERSDAVTEVFGINTDEGRAAVRDADPDILAVYGTGIVGRRVLSMAATRALNLHTGMSPEYRGADCVFWPLHDRRLDLVGATVHECTADVDGGEIYARSRADLEPGDGPFGVFARCVEVGTDLYVDVIRKLLAGELTGTPQDLSIGREFRAADKRLRDDLSVRRLFSSGEFASAVAGDRSEAPT